MRLFFIILWFTFVFPGVSVATDKKCSDTFDSDSEIRGSKLDYQLTALKKNQKTSQDLQPKFENPRDERRLVPKWNEKPFTPPVFEAFLPEGVFLVKYQQYQPGAPSVVKLENPSGGVVIARAGYRYKGREFHTNVFFSAQAIRSNMKTEENYLAGADAELVIVYLHGGGTKSTGAHTANSMIAHFAKMGVHVLAMDLGWHGQGHREFVTLETDIQLLSAFAKKYIPPNVPLFVMGHSWGSVFTEQLMLMTANPEFSFHPNLRGLMIFSTAVTGAKSGTSLAEREKEVTRRLENTKKIILQKMKQKDSSLEYEVLDIFNNIIKDGKWSPTGGLYSTLTILQLLQEIPKHEGREYIDTLVVVGKHDDLVYIGNEDLYHNYYPKLQNVEFPPPFDKLPHNKSEGVLWKVGHIIQDYKTLDGKNQIHYDLMIKFMENKLKTHTVKKDIDARVRKSALEAEAKESIIKSLRHLRTLDAITKFIDTNKHIQLLDSHVLSSLKNTIVEMQNASVLSEKPNSDSGNFIEIMQLFANDLAFREFIQDYRIYEVRGTKERGFFIDKRTEITAQLTQILSPYFTNLRRVSWFIHQLSEMTGEKGLGRLEELKEQSTALQKERKGLPKGQQRKELREKLTLLQAEKAELQNKIRELQDEMDYLSSPVALQSLNNNTLRTMITELKEAFDTAPKLLSSRFTGNTRHAVEHLVEKVKQIQEAPVVQQELKNIKKGSTKNKNNFVTKMLGSKDIDTAMEIINEKQIPESVKTQVQPLLEMGLTTQEVLDGYYIPPVKNMGVRENSPDREHDQGRIDYAVKDLEKNVAEYKRIANDLTKVKHEENKLKVEHNALLEELRGHIKTIRDELDTLSTYPPESLKNDFRDLERMFEEELLPAEAKMERLLDQLSPEFIDNNKKILNQKEVIKLIDPHQPVIQEFANKFQKYHQKRRELNEKAITAMEAGEKGEEAKKAVIAVYGPGSQGRQPLPGSGSLYIKLQRLTEELAKVEAKIYDLEGRKVETIMSYKKGLNSVAGLVSSDKDPDSYDMLKRVISSIEPVELTPIDILNKGGEKQKLAEQLLSNKSEENKILEKVLKQWNDMTSALPPRLPTEEQ